LTSNTISCIRLHHLLALFPRWRPVVPFSVALLRCISLPLANAKNSPRILAHSHLEIVQPAENPDFARFFREQKIFSKKIAKEAGKSEDM